MTDDPTTTPTPTPTTPTTKATPGGHVKRILITGSRDWRRPDIIRAALVAHGPGVVVHGAARGADTLAALVAKLLKWPAEPHAADWKRDGKRAGHLRNARMVALGADVCLAFPGPDSIGTWDCVHRARAAGIPVHIFTEDELGHMTFTLEQLAAAPKDVEGT